LAKLVTHRVLKEEMVAVFSFSTQPPRDCNCQVR